MHQRVSRPLRRVPARRFAAGLLLLTRLLPASWAVTSPASAREDLTAARAAAPLPPPAPGVIRITQANLLSGQPAPTSRPTPRRC